MFFGDHDHIKLPFEDGRQRQEDLEFEASLSYSKSLSPKKAGNSG
jgi:hypothetical protein